MVSAVEREIERLEAIRAEMQPTAGSKRKPRILSEEGRRRIVEAQHRRWARAGSGTAASSRPGPATARTA